MPCCARPPCNPSSRFLVWPWHSEGADFITCGSARTNIISESFIIGALETGENSPRWPSCCVQPAVVPPAGPRVSIPSAQHGKDWQPDWRGDPGPRPKNTAFLCRHSFYLEDILHFFVPFPFLFMFISCTAMLSDSGSRRPRRLSCRLCRACPWSGTWPCVCARCCLCQRQPRGIYQAVRQGRAGPGRQKTERGLVLHQGHGPGKAVPGPTEWPGHLGRLCGVGPWLHVAELQQGRGPHRLQVCMAIQWLQVCLAVWPGEAQGPSSEPPGARR